ncbi:MAG: efflux RND transporter periplasmic adaptor subunit [Acidobacteriota bacterium]|nr:efflux RND transporter periplasmic adaptor subunit [Acidobacteriota bacterium]
MNRSTTPQRVPSPISLQTNLSSRQILRKLPLVASCGLILLLGACAGGSDPSAEAALPAPAVEAVPAREGALPLEERLSGTVKARNQVAIRPEIEAPVTAVLVESGATVTQGQPLVRLDGSRLQDQLRQAEASLRLAEGTAAEARARVAEVEAETVRSRRLAEEDLISELELETLEAQLSAAQASAEQAEARVEQARATVQERRSDVARAVVRSPVSGRVGQRNAEVGMLVDPNTTLFMVGDLTQLRVEIPLTEAMLGYIEEGQPVRILPNGGEPLEATLTRISPFLDENSFSTVGEIDFDSPQAPLRPGTFVAVDVLYGESDRVTLVPTAAAWEDPATGVLGVYVLDSAQGLSAPPESASGADADEASLPPLSEETYPVTLRPVEVLAEGRGMIGVTDVEEGEWVVTQGQQLLSGSAADELAARVRPASWQRVLNLQDLQREDLLRRFLAKQRRYAEERGSQPPSNREYLAPAIGDGSGEGGSAEQQSGEDR